MARSSVVGIQKTLKASADLSAATKQFTFVKASGNQTITTCGAGETMLGVQQDLAASGKACMFRITGTSKLRVDGTTPIAAGDKLKSDAAGKGVKASATNIAGAIALEGATADGVVIEALLISAGPM